MKRFFLLALIALMILTGPAFAADVKVTALPAAESVAGTDIVPVVVNPGTTPVTKKATIDVLGTYFGGTFETKWSASDTGFAYITAGAKAVRTIVQTKSDLGIVAWGLGANLRVCTDGSNNPVDCGTTPFTIYSYAPHKTVATGHTYTEAEVAGGVISNYNMSGAKVDHFPAVPTAGTKVVNFIILYETKCDADWDIIRQGSDTITLHKGDGTMVTGKTYLRFHDLTANCLVSCFSQPNTAVWNCSLASATTCPVTTD